MSFLQSNFFLGSNRENSRKQQVESTETDTPRYSIKLDTSSDCVKTRPTSLKNHEIDKEKQKKLEEEIKAIKEKYDVKFEDLLKDYNLYEEVSKTSLPITFFKQKTAIEKFYKEKFELKLDKIFDQATLAKLYKYQYVRPNPTKYCLQPKDMDFVDFLREVAKEIILYHQKGFQFKNFAYSTLVDEERLKELKEEQKKVFISPSTRKMLKQEIKELTEEIETKTQAWKTIVEVFCPAVENLQDDERAKLADYIEAKSYKNEYYKIENQQREEIIKVKQKYYSADQDLTTTM